MYETVLAIGFVFMAFAAVWSIFKALQTAVLAKTKEDANLAIPYLVAFLLLAGFTYYLGLLLPLR